MKALGIVGSYRAGGTIDRAVDDALGGAQGEGFTIEKLTLANENIGYCRNCRRCTQRPGITPGECQLDDAMGSIIARCLEADVLILGSPVNYGSVTAATKTFQERLSPLVSWTWGSPMPKLRLAGRSPRPRAVLINASLAPAIVAKRMSTAARTLRDISAVFDARVTDELWFGLSGRRQDEELPDRRRRAARRAGARAARHRGHDSWKIWDETRARLKSRPT